MYACTDSIAPINQLTLNVNSGYRRSCELRGIRFRTSHLGYTIGCSECLDRVCFISAVVFAVNRLTMHSAVLGSYFLNERLGTLGKLGCAMCLLGSVVIVLHAPPDKPVESIEEILGYALSPGNYNSRETTINNTNALQASCFTVSL